MCSHCHICKSLDYHTVSRLCSAVNSPGKAVERTSNLYKASRTGLQSAGSRYSYQRVTTPIPQTQPHLVPQAARLFQLLPNLCKLLPPLRRLARPLERIPIHPLTIHPNLPRILPQNYLPCRQPCPIIHIPQPRPSRADTIPVLKNAHLEPPPSAEEEIARACGASATHQLGGGEEGLHGAFLHLVKVEDAAVLEVRGRDWRVDGEMDVRCRELDVGGEEQHMVDMDGGRSAVQIEGHVTRGVGVVAVFGIERAVFECREGCDFDILGDGFAVGGDDVSRRKRDERGKEEAQTHTRIWMLSRLQRHRR